MSQHPDFKKALSTLRKLAKLEEKKAAIEQQIDELGSDQFMFDEAAWNAAMKAHKAEIL